VSKLKKQNNQKADGDNFESKFLEGYNNSILNKDNAIDLNNINGGPGSVNKLELDNDD